MKYWWIRIIIFESFNTSDYNFKDYTHSETYKSISSNNINHITGDSGGNLWISTNDNGICFYERHTNQFTVYNKPFLPTNQITCSILTTKNTIYIGTKTHGVLEYDIKTQKIINISSENKNKNSFDDQKNKAQTPSRPKSKVKKHKKGKKTRVLSPSCLIEKL